MENSTRNILIFTLVLLIAGGLLYYFFVYKKKAADTTAAAAPPAGSTAALIPPGTTVTTSTGSSIVIAITELIQALLTNKPFADNPKIKDGTVPVKYSNVMGDCAVGTRVIFDRTSGTTLNVYGDRVPYLNPVGGHNYELTIPQALASTSMAAGIQLKNIIWIATDNVDTSAYGYPGTSYAVRLYAHQYFVEGSEKVFDFPSTTYSRWIQASNRQFKYISTALTQVDLNAAGG